jgi:signal transduction histidine kinase
MPSITKPHGVHWWISAALIFFGFMVLAALCIQSFSSQHLIEHRYWADLLESVSADHAARVREGRSASLPNEGIIRSWYVEQGSGATQAPDYLAELPAGLYSTEGGYGIFTAYLDELLSGHYSTKRGYGTFTTPQGFQGDDSFHALVVDLPPGRLITAIDIAELENQQNHDARYSVVWAGILVLFIGGVIAWLHANLVRPVRDLADRMQAIDPRDTGTRLPTTYKREEIQVIAQASNAHLERVEQFIERERSLLDQASHEFRTPIAVIAGALDVLKQIPLPDASRPALRRVEYAVEDLSETMVALLYLAREPEPGSEAADVTVLHEVLPRLLHDHQHLLHGKSAQLKVGELEPTHVAAPEAMVRIAVSNLIRNAVENTEVGTVELTLSAGVISIVDSGSGFNPVEAARRYRDSLRRSAPVRGQGLGLFLIGRICDHYRWKLSIEPVAKGGTRAMLDVTASAIPP